MLTSVFRRRLYSSRICLQAVRAQGTSVEKGKGGPVGDDGRHEIWREDINDHDNAPNCRT